MSRNYAKSSAKEKNIARKKPAEQESRNGFKLLHIAGLLEKAYHAETDNWVPVERGTVYAAYEIAYRALQHVSNVKVGQYKIRSIEEDGYGY